jgi:hypothetical protein
MGWHGIRSSALVYFSGVRERMGATFRRINR